MKTVRPKGVKLEIIEGNVSKGIHPIIGKYYTRKLRPEEIIEMIDKIAESIKPLKKEDK